MLIVAGTIRTAPRERAAFLSASEDAMRRARDTEGCHAFVAAADPLEGDLVNVFERWDDATTMLAFREGGPSSDLRSMIAHADVRRYEIAREGEA